MNNIKDVISRFSAVHSKKPGAQNAGSEKSANSANVNRAASNPSVLVQLRSSKQAPGSAKGREVKDFQSARQLADDISARLTGQEHGEISPDSVVTLLKNQQ